MIYKLIKQMTSIMMMSKPKSNKIGNDIREFNRKTAQGHGIVIPKKRNKMLN